MAAPQPRVSSTCPGDAQDFARDAEYLIAQGIDAQRAKFAVDAPPLQPDPDLIEVARGRSCEMALGEREFSHTDAQGNFIAASRVRERFGPYGAIGENIMEMGGSRAFDAREFARIAVDGWMKSPGHRANILNPRYDQSGIGVALVGNQAYATQVFFGPPRPRNQTP
ncbi:MAG TPA: CAP domain-containing protein [Rhizomicrobium sp.]|nr:CAP domain-containing protein [Rhizomicrobium sp.]